MHADTVFIEDLFFFFFFFQRRQSDRILDIQSPEEIENYAAVELHSSFSTKILYTKSLFHANNKVAF